MKPSQAKPMVQRIVIEELNRQKKAMEIEIIKTMIATFLLTLHDKHDWDKDMLNQLVREVTMQYACIRDKFVKVEDIEQWCEELGIEGV